MGGKLAYLAACRTDASVSVSYYGVGIDKALNEAGQIKNKLVLHIAEKDQFCPPEAQAAITGALAGHPHVETYVYPGVDHAFARNGGDHFDKPAALMAHQRSMAAFKAAICALAVADPAPVVAKHRIAFCGKILRHCGLPCMCAAADFIAAADD